jgi:hypothetical protein
MHIDFDRYYDIRRDDRASAGAGGGVSEACHADVDRPHNRGAARSGSMEITNPDTGPALEKPGFYIDAQIHAEEHATSATALYAIWYLLTRYGTDPEVTRLVDQQVFYIIPRINPDGAEYALKAPYHPWCGNGRYLPGEERLDGLVAAGHRRRWLHRQYARPRPQGRMEERARRAAPDGAARTGRGGRRILPHLSRGPDPRLMTACDVKIEMPQADGNMNRNFPINWSPQEYGAGEYPFSEPEAMGMARLILDHPNICGMCAYHTHGGIILRPSMMKRWMPR